jgi:hypothetical protein
MSPTPASGSLLRCAPKPKGSMRKSDLAPLLSAQFRTAPTGRPRVIRNFEPAPEAEIRPCQNVIPENTCTVDIQRAVILCKIDGTQASDVENQSFQCRRGMHSLCIVLRRSPERLRLVTNDIQTPLLQSANEFCLILTNLCSIHDQVYTCAGNRLVPT